MSAFHFPATYRYLFAFFLAAAMLGTNWIGFAHDIKHPKFTSSYYPSSAGHNAHSTTIVDSGQHEQGEVLHSCLAFDAATLADALDCLPFSLPMIVNFRALALWTAFASWDVPLQLHFSSRAPPSA